MPDKRRATRRSAAAALWLALSPLSICAPSEALANSPSSSNADSAVSIGSNRDSFKELKKLLKTRFEGKEVHVVVGGISAGEQRNSSFLGKTSENALTWHHYCEGMQIPKRVSPILGHKIEDMTRLDPRTFGDLGGTGLNVTPIDRGEALRVFHIEAIPGWIQLALTADQLAHMKDLDIAKASKETHINSSNGITSATTVVGHFGLAFEFHFPEAVSADTAIVLSEIAKYLVLPEEWQKLATQDNEIKIDLGMTESDLVQRMGQPIRSVTFGDQKTMKYKDLTVVLKGGKVTDVRME